MDGIHDLSDPTNVKRGMLLGLQALREHVNANPEICTACYVFACTCIDGLALPARNQVKADIVAFIKANMANLDALVGAEDFYTNFRCAAVHEFSVKAPYLIGRGEVDGPYLTDLPSDTNRKILNFDRFVSDVINLLEPEEVPPAAQPPTLAPPLQSVSASTRSVSGNL